MTADVMVIVERRFDHPQQVVFDAWTAPEQMQEWRGSPGWHVERDTVSSELRVGGRHHHVKLLDDDPSTRVTTDAMSTAVAVAREHGATVSAALLVDADPAQALLEIAEERDADLVVIGARHDVSLADRLLGTVATEVVRRAACEVLIVLPQPDTGDLPVPESRPVDPTG